MFRNYSQHMQNDIGYVEYGGSGVELPEMEQCAMTLLAAMLCEGHVLVASDSIVQDDIGVYVQQKLWQLCDSPLVWGGSGDSRICDDLRYWLQSHKTFEALDTAMTATGKDRGFWLENWAMQLASINGINRLRLTKSRAEPFRIGDVTTEIMVAGFVDDSALIASINRQGVPSYDTGRGWLSAGSEFQRFAGAFQALMPSHFRTLPIDEAAPLFGQAMEAAIRDSSKASFPVQMWFVSPKCAKNILGIEEEYKPLAERLKVPIKEWLNSV